jgi:pimeloyl-ACP methyl ester carboxylesterase
MESVFFEHAKGKVHALRFGHGPRLLVALHGFGDRARMFAVLEDALNELYTVVALDLPFHGQTTWNDQTFSKEDLVSIIRQVMQREGKDRLSMMAFSFGGRITLALLPEFEPHLDKLYLLSPDGINTQGMSLAVRIPMPVRRGLYKALERPDWFLKIVSTGRKMGVVPPLINHFLASNLTRPERFRRTFGCWLALNSFYLRRRKIKALWKAHNLPIDIYFGNNDEMIRLKTLRAMTEGLPNVRLFVIEDAGHRVVNEELMEHLISNRVFKP